MRAFGTGGRIAEVEARIEAEMRAASAEGWEITDASGIGNGDAKCCCAMGAVVRDVLTIMRDEDEDAEPDEEAMGRLRIAIPQYQAIASGFDGETFDPDTDPWVHLGRRLKVLGDELNARRAP